MTTMTQVTMGALTEVLSIAYENSINVFITGRPGIGKTQTVVDFARFQQEEDPEFKLFTFYAPTMTPIDIQATMPDQETGALRFYNNEALPNAYSNPDLRGIIFFGELPNADPVVVKSLQKYVNGEDLNGCLRKPQGLRVVVDGNRLSDRAGVLQQSRAFLSRFMHVEVEPQAEQSLAYMRMRRWHPSVIAFLEQNPAMIDKYDAAFQGETSEEARRGVWASMRSWERVSQLEWWAEQKGVGLPYVFLAGNVGSSVAVHYTTYRELLSKLATKDEILANPEGIEIPEEISEKYALVYMLALRIGANDLDRALVFFARLEAELQVLGAKVILMNPALANIREKNKNFLRFITSKGVAELIR